MPTLSSPSTGGQQVSTFVDSLPILIAAFVFLILFGLGQLYNGNGQLWPGGLFIVMAACIAPGIHASVATRPPPAPQVVSQITTNPGGGVGIRRHAVPLSNLDLSSVDASVAAAFATQGMTASSGRSVAPFS